MLIQKLPRLDRQRFCDFGHDLNGWVACTALNVADIGPVDARMIGEGFLT